MNVSVYTTLGEVSQDVLRWEYEERDEGNTILLARSWFYTGSDPQHLETIATQKDGEGNSFNHVRRDVWVTVKVGHAAAAQQG